MKIKPSLLRSPRAINAALAALALISALALTAPHARAQARQRDLKVTPSDGVAPQWPIKAKRWALVIGVDAYKDGQIGSLKGAANDARGLANALTAYAGFPADQVILLTTDQPDERQPTRVNILRRLSNLAAVVPPDGLLLVSFAGHGMERNGQAFLLPSDAQIADDVTFLEETAISVTRMKDRIRATGVKQIVLMLDACRNDPVGRADAPNPLTQAYTRGFNFDVRNREVEAFAVLYATAIGHRAYEYTEKRQGYFTWAVVEAMKGAAANRNGEVTLAGLLKFVQDVVPKRIAIDLGGGKQQRPFALVEGYKAEELVIAAPGRSARPAEDTAATARSTDSERDQPASVGTQPDTAPPTATAGRGLEGTVWTVAMPGGESTIVFLGKGLLRFKEPDASWTVGTWKQTGNSIVFQIADYSIWQGTFEDELIKGQASNVDERKWQWFMTRTGPAPASDLSAPSVEGTTWTGESGASGEKFTVQFLEGGRLRYKTGGDWINGTWKQAGVTVRFVVNNASVWEGDIEGRMMKGGYYIIGQRRYNRPWSLTREGP